MLTQKCKKNALERCRVVDVCRYLKLVDFGFAKRVSEKRVFCLPSFF